MHSAAAQHVGRDVQARRVDGVGDLLSNLLGALVAGQGDPSIGGIPVVVAIEFEHDRAGPVVDRNRVLIADHTDASARRGDDDGKSAVHVDGRFTGNHKRRGARVARRVVGNREHLTDDELVGRVLNFQILSDSHGRGVA